MSFSDAELIALSDSGVSAAQLVAAIIAGRADRRARRQARMVSTSTVEPDTKMNEPDNTVRVEPDTDRQRGGMSGRKALASRALGLVAGLTATAVRVGSVLIDSYNLETGRCDPLIGSIARRLGICERSARRAIALLQRQGLLVVRRHGGAGHRNAFTPAWATLEAIVAGDGWPGHATRTESTAEPDNVVRQKLKKKTRVYASARRPDPAQKSFLYPLAGGRDAAEDSAVRRVWRATHDRWGRSEAALALVIGLDAAVYAEAHTAEQQRRGSGIRVIERALQATGPPDTEAFG